MEFEECGFLVMKSLISSLFIEKDPLKKRVKNLNPFLIFCRQTCFSWHKQGLKKGLKKVFNFSLFYDFFVQVSFDLAEYTANVDAVGTLRLLDAIKTCGLENDVRFYQVT